MMSQIKDLVTALVPGRKGKVLSASIGLGGAALTALAALWPATPGQSNPIVLPFKEENLVLVTKGLDPHGGVCSQQVSLSDPKAYGLETNNIKITKRTVSGFEATFTSDQTPGTWSMVGKGSGRSMTGAFHLEGGGQGTFKVQKDADKTYAVGWSEFRDCVGKVELMCPVVMGPDDATKAALRTNGHLKENCINLPLPKEVVVQN